MFRIKRFRKNKYSFITLFTIIFVIFFFFSIGYSLLKQTLSISGTATTLKNNISNNVSFTTNSWFDGNLYYYKISVQIYNNYSQPFSSWNVSMDVPNDANLLNHSGIFAYILDSKIICTSTSYNSNIAPNESTYFEFQLSTLQSSYLPTNINFNGNILSPPDLLPPEENIPFPVEYFDISFSVTNSWKNNGFNYYQYDVKISNLGTKLSIKSWQFDVVLPKHSDINQYWNVNLDSDSDENLFILSNLDYNGFVPPNSSITFGLIIETKVKNFIPTPTNILVK